MALSRSSAYGLVAGSLIADAQSLGVHWVYDPAVITQRHGRLTEMVAPGPDSYHPKKQAGDQGHVGDQALCLWRSVTQRSGWSPAGFMEDWRALWPTYTDYIDKATKTTLAQLEAPGVSRLEAGAPSDELAGPARMAPLLAFLAEKEESAWIDAAVAQTLLTHRSPETTEAALFLARATYRLGHGAALEPTIRELAPDWAVALATPHLTGHASTTEVIGTLGRSCSLRAALPSVIFLALRHGHDFEEACIENTQAGGDNCARGLALGMLLGAHHGAERIPARWMAAWRARELFSSLA
jgi:ADP-ribosylglycohydrolase